MFYRQITWKEQSNRKYVLTLILMYVLENTKLAAVSMAFFKINQQRQLFPGFFSSTNLSAMG